MSITINPFTKVKVTPYSTTISTPNIYSPFNLSPFNLSPVEPIITNLVSPTYVVPTVTPFYQLEIDTGLNDNPFAQKQMVDYIMAKIYNDWIYSKDMCYLLKYLVVRNDKAYPVSKIEDFKDNKICDDTEKDVDTKIDYIEEHILSKNDLKKLLKRMIDELGYKWYEFPQKLSVIEDAVEKHIRHELKSRIGSQK